MSANTLTVTCHACGAATLTALSRPDLGIDGGDLDRLAGTRVTCTNCGSEFDCYYY